MESGIFRGKVTSYPAKKEKGLVEVSIGAYDKDKDKLVARVDQSQTGVYWLPELDDVVEVEVPEALGCEAHIVHIHRKEDDEQTQSCWTKNNDLKQIKTRSGHKVTLDDTKDDTSFTIHTAGGLELKLEDKKKTVTIKAENSEEPALKLDMDKNEISLEAGKKLSIKCAGASIEIDSSGNISISAKGKLNLSAQNIAADAKTKFSAKGQQTEISGGLSAKISGSSQLELSSSGIAQLKGSMVKLN